MSEPKTPEEVAAIVATLLSTVELPINPQPSSNLPTPETAQPESPLSPLEQANRIKNTLSNSDEAANRILLRLFEILEDEAALHEGAYTNPPSVHALNVALTRNGFDLRAEDILSLAAPEFELCDPPGFLTGDVIDHIVLSLSTHQTRTESSVHLIRSQHVRTALSEGSRPNEGHQRRLRCLLQDPEGLAANPLFSEIPLVRDYHMAYLVGGNHLIHIAYHIDADLGSARISIRDSLNQTNAKDSLLATLRLLGRLIFFENRFGLRSFDWESCQIDIYQSKKQYTMFDCGVHVLNSILTAFPVQEVDARPRETFGSRMRIFALTALYDLLEPPAVEEGHARGRVNGQPGDDNNPSGSPGQGQSPNDDDGSCTGGGANDQTGHDNGLPGQGQTRGDKPDSQSSSSHSQKSRRQYDSDTESSRCSRCGDSCSLYSCSTCTTIGCSTCSGFSASDTYSCSCSTYGTSFCSRSRARVTTSNSSQSWSNSNSSSPSSYSPPASLPACGNQGSSRNDENYTCGPLKPLSERQPQESLHSQQRRLRHERLEDWRSVEEHASEGPYDSDSKALGAQPSDGEPMQLGDYEPSQSGHEGAALVAQHPDAGPMQPGNARAPSAHNSNRSNLDHIPVEEDEQEQRVEGRISNDHETAFQATNVATHNAGNVDNVEPAELGVRTKALTKETSEDEQSDRGEPATASAQTTTKNVAYQKWSSDEEDTLREKYMAGLTAKQIHVHLPSRSLRAVRNHITALKKRLVKEGRQVSISHKPWSKEEDATLLGKSGEGCKAAEIAHRYLIGRSEGAIGFRLFVLRRQQALRHDADNQDPHDSSHLAQETSSAKPAKSSTQETSGGKPVRSSAHANDHRPEPLEAQSAISLTPEQISMFVELPGKFRKRPRKNNEAQESFYPLLPDKIGAPWLDDFSQAMSDIVHTRVFQRFAKARSGKSYASRLPLVQIPFTIAVNDCASRQPGTKGAIKCNLKKQVESLPSGYFLPVTWTAEMAGQYRRGGMLGRARDTSVVTDWFVRDMANGSDINEAMLLPFDLAFAEPLPVGTDLGNAVYTVALHVPQSPTSDRLIIIVLPMALLLTSVSDMFDILEQQSPPVAAERGDNDGSFTLMLSVSSETCADWMQSRCVLFNKSLFERLMGILEERYNRGHGLQTFGEMSAEVFPHDQGAGEDDDNDADDASTEEEIDAQNVNMIVDDDGDEIEENEADIGNITVIVDEDDEDEGHVYNSGDVVEYDDGQ